MTFPGKKLAALVLAAALTAASGAESVCNLQRLPEALPLYGQHTEEEAFLLQLTSCGVTDIIAAAEDVTAQLDDPDIPENALRGYAFRLSIREDALWPDGTAVTGADVKVSLERYLEQGSCPQRLHRLEREIPKEIQSLKEAGFQNIHQAAAAGHTRFYINVADFWGLEAGWQSLDSRARLRDWAIPAGVGEMYVTPAYLYRQYLSDGARYQRLQAQFVGIAGSTETRRGISVSQTGDVLLVFSRPTTASALLADLEGAVLQRGDGMTCGAYVLKGNVLTRNEFWWGDFPCDEDTIVCKITGGSAAQ